MAKLTAVLALLLGLLAAPAHAETFAEFGGDKVWAMFNLLVEMARLILGEDWLQQYVARANAGGIERVLV